ncbi:hypothetical protein CERSUDRAFT_111467 [Gelatoporia subvermispora B]|uniref:Threonylcarbamoyl-AMP synthase n=1 Tax=Ceriporiopsis subvermispora (strain B) TaxID=914234 RepID=M2RPT6_CERS8|nr:hypothetical protein CERSUDRAFT_111467 [Gelatoporia subvermispora B]
MTDAPIAAPSANSSGKPSPTRAEHVLKDLNGKLGLILDGGACGVGLESTVVDTLHEDGNVRILRPGGVTVEDIEKALREEVLESSSIPKVLVHKRDYRDEAIEQAPTTPGMKYRHYSPAVPVVLLHTSTPPTGINQVAVTSYLETLKSRTLDSGRPPKVGLLMASDSPILPIATGVERVTWHVHSLGSADTPAVAAQRLFDGLLTLEGMEVDLILIEELKEEREGLAVMNRVRKAAGESVWVKV